MTSTTVLFFLKPGAVKRISRFKAFATSIGSSQDIIKQAYEAASKAARDEQKHGALPFLVYASEGPDFSGNSGLSVCTTPLGYSRHISSEQDARSLVWACLRAVQVLHKAGLVHSDIRLSNTVWLNEKHCMVIDLEHCRKANKALPDNCKRLKDWDDGTLELKKKKYFFTPASDLYQIGRMLQKLWKSSWSPESASFLALLLSKKTPADLGNDSSSLSANTALQHLWMKGLHEAPRAKSIKTARELQREEDLRAEATKKKNNLAAKTKPQDKIEQDGTGIRNLKRK